MAQYVGIGILYQAFINSKDVVSRKHLEEKYPPEIFSYEYLDKESRICLRPEVTGKELGELRASVLDFCGLPGEEDREHPRQNLEAKIRERLSKMTLDEAVKMATEVTIYSFHHYDKYSRRICWDNTQFGANENFIMIYSFGQFYHEGERYLCEVTSLLDKLIQHHLASNKLGQLVMVFFV